MNAIVYKQHMAIAVWAIAVLCATQPIEAAVIHVDVDVDIPPTYSVDLGDDGVVEFEIIGTRILFDGLIANTNALAEGVGFLDNRNPSNGLNNLVDEGTWINSSDSFFIPPPSSSESVLLGPGYIGVEFELSGDTHFGYVGYERGHVFALGWNDTPGEGIRAGGVPEPSSLMLAGVSLAAVIVRRRWRST